MKSKTTVSTKPLSETIVTESDFDSDGKIDSRDTLTTTDDRQGNLISSVFENDVDADGKIDSKNVTSNTYDKQGNLTGSVVERDNNADGKIDSKAFTSNTYNQQGKLIRSVVENDDNADGKIDRKDVTSNTYDKQGKLTRSVVENDDNADGKIDNINVTSNTYDRKGNLIRSVFEIDFGADGIIDTRTTTNAIYDRQNRLSGVNVVSGMSDKVDRLINYQPVELSGGNGNNLVTGTDKADVLTGGKGADIFVVAADTGFDTITDFQKGTDLIGLAKGVSFSQLSFDNDRVLLQGETLATLTGVQTSILTADSFINI